MRIVYVIDSLASKGGAERILSDKMNYMASHFGYDVHVITCYQNPEKDPNVYFLSDKVKQTNLNIHYYSQYHYGYPKRLLAKWEIYRTLRRRLTETVKSLDPDVLVGLGYFRADMVMGIRCRAAKVVESHEARIFTMSDRGLERSWLSRCYMRYYKQRYFRAVERRADVVVTLTQGDAKEWNKARKVVVIPNFTVMPVSKMADGNSHRVIAVGRLEWQKGFDRLIDAWAKVADSHPDWRLDIFGSGTLESKLNRRISRKNLKNISIHPFTSDIISEYAASSIFALTSRFEGFGLVLLEAMHCGVPCVTFDCPYGPSDVVADSQCGFVVQDGDVTSFAGRLSLLMDDDELRRQYGAAAVERAQLFSADKVMAQWKRLFERLVNGANSAKNR
jgi:glycosyltransferase involved in cell wall biosynthesis